MTNISIAKDQPNIDEDTLISALEELGSSKAEAEKFAIDIISGYGFSMKARSSKEASHIVKLLGNAGVRVKTAHESKNS